ncbi:MAG: hypothetical protein KJO82_12740, partial [Gammaproteobacteria bacterium]|nr:hypothetical protein [Gammaproteobacteria bacterium]
MDNIDTTDDEQLSAYIDGELTDAEVATLVTRLANEPALVKRLEAMRSGDQAVRAVYESLERVPLPDGVTQLLDIKDGESGDDNVVTFRRRGMPRLANFGYAIAASVALVAGFLAFRQGDVDPGLTAIDALVAGNLGPDSDIHAFLDTGVS